jgi:AcrR family transcriptional regulator
MQKGLLFRLLKIDAQNSFVQRDKSFMATKTGAKNKPIKRGKLQASTVPVKKPAKASGAALTAPEKTRSNGSEQSINRILDATMEAISRQGVRNVSMSDVCRFAGVARGTLYRYFPSKEVLLESLGQRTRQQTEDGIRAAAANTDSGEEALVAVINFLTGFAGDSKAAAMLEVEPLFFMDFLRRHMPHYADVVADSLKDYFDELESRLGYKIDRLQCAELLLRLQTSYIFLPDPEPGEHLLETVLSALNRVAQRSPK